ncbi:hypothetical protein D3C80_1470200 [compost metagenome]
MPVFNSSCNDGLHRRIKQLVEKIEDLLDLLQCFYRILGNCEESGIARFTRQTAACWSGKKGYIHLRVRHCLD